MILKYPFLSKKMEQNTVIFPAGWGVTYESSSILCPNSFINLYYPWDCKWENLKWWLSWDTIDPEWLHTSLYGMSNNNSVLQMLKYIGAK